MKHKLSGIIGDRHRQVIHAVVDEVFVKPDDNNYALKLMPVKNVPASILINERLSGMGGQMGERVLGEKGKAINAGSSQVRYFAPGAYQEHVRFDEKDLLMLRKYGSIGERGATGLTSGELDEMSRSAMKLQVRLKNRMHKLIWDSLFNGTYVYKGQTFSFDIPVGNTIAAGSDWSVGGSTGKPLTDLWTIQNTNAKLLKYKIKEFIINPKTNADALKCDEIRNVLVNHYGAAGDLNKVASILYPGLAPITVVRDVWQDESVVAGEIVLGNAQFFVPDDKILVIVELAGTLYPAFGEFDLTENLNDPSATLDTPAVGVYTFVDEKGLEERENPHAKIVSGFNGAPNLLRPNDVFVITC